MRNEYHGLIFTNHAIQRLYQRQIAQSDAWYTLRHPDGRKKGKTPGSWKFYKQYGRQRIEVVGKKNEHNEWVILSCWSKYKGNNKPMFNRQSILEKAIKKLLQKIFAQKKKAS